MRPFLRCAFLHFLLVLGLSFVTFAQGNILVSRNMPVSVHHTGPTSQSSLSLPSKLTDGVFSASNFYEFLAGNEGARVVISLNDVVSLNRVEIRSFLLSAKDFRLRGYELRSSLDSIQWTLLTADSSVDTTLIDIMFNPQEARYFELRVTQMDTGASAFSTVLTEISLWARIDRPTVSGVAVAAPTSDTSQFRSITWGSFLWDSGRTVSIFAGSRRGDLQPLAANVPNSGTYAWFTSIEPDGPRLIQVIPDTVVRITGEASATIANFSQVGLRLLEHTLPFNGGTWPLQYSTALSDSITLQFSYRWRYPFPHEQEISFSPDSGTSWFVVNSSVDTSRRRVTIPATQLLSGTADGLFRLRILRDGLALLTTTMSEIIQIPGIPAGGSLLWGRSRISSPAEDAGLLAYENTYGPSTIVAGHQWLVRGNGDSVNHWMLHDVTHGFTAAGDLDGDGITEIVTNWANQTRVTSDTGNPGFPNSWREGYSYDVRLADVDADDTLEIVLNNASQVIVTDNRLNTMFTYLYSPGWFDAISVNVAGDDQLELVAVNSNTIFVYNRFGQSLPGFPSMFATNFNSRVTPIDIEGDGHFEFLVPSVTHLYCLNGSGSVLSGFPFALMAPLLSPPSIGDIDADGSLDIVFITGSYVGMYAMSLPTVHCIDKSGKELEGWPLQLSEGSYHRINRYLNGVFYEGENVFYRALPSRPLIASIDGDLYSEILITTADGYLIVLNGDGTMRSGYPVFIGTRTPQTGVLGDFDKNGSLNFVYPLFFETPTRYAIHNIDFGPGTYNPNAIPWPMEMQNSLKTSISPPAFPVTVSQEKESIPAVFSLSQNFPNPFNPSTTIRYSLPRSVQTTVRVLDMLGRSVATLVDEFRNAGTHSINFDGSRLASGVYFLHIVAGQDRSVRKMLLMK